MVERRRKNDSKILILYMLDKLRYPVTFDELHDLLVGGRMLESIRFTTCLAELVEVQNVLMIHGSAKELYTISEQGRRVCYTLLDRLTEYTQRRVENTARRLIDFDRLGGRVNQKVERDENGRYILTFSISDGMTDLLEMKVNIEKNMDLLNAQTNISDYPEILYNRILGILTTDIASLKEDIKYQQ